MEAKIKPIICLLGRPNVGKSSLFNALIKERISLISAKPGTTRDRHYANLHLHEQLTCTLVDTGGFFGPKEDYFSPYIQEQVLKACEEAHLILFVVNREEGLHPLDQDIFQLLKKKNLNFFLLVNKSDHASHEKDLMEFYRFSEKIYPVSAAHTRGLEELKEDLSKHFSSIEVEEKDQSERSFLLLGKPNVGKSTLMNALLKKDRSIVSEKEGTTLTPIKENLFYKDKNYTIVDTAGVRKSSKKEQSLEQLAFYATLRALQEVQVVLFLFDASKKEITHYEKRLLDLVLNEGKSLLLVFNKIDLVEDKKDLQELINKELPWLNFTEQVFISALEKKNIQHIFSKLDHIFYSLENPPSTSQLNKVIEESQHDYPNLKQKISYIVQVKKIPPTFLCFCSQPEKIEENFKKFLINSLRKKFTFSGTSLKLIFRKK